MLTSPLVKGGGPQFLVIQASLPASDMGEQVSGEENHPRGQTWAESRELFWKQQKDTVGRRARGWHCAPQSPASVGPGRAGSGRRGLPLAALRPEPQEPRFPLGPISCRYLLPPQSQQGGLVPQALHGLGIGVPSEYL